MANIVPSDNRSVLAYQLYFLRAVLSNLYLEANEIRQKYLHLETIKNEYKSVQSTLCYLEGAVIDEYYEDYSPSAIRRHRRGEYIYKSKRGVYIAARVIVIVISVLVAAASAIAILLFEPQSWYYAILCGVVAVTLGVTFSLSIKDKFKPNRKK